MSVLYKYGFKAIGRTRLKVCRNHRPESIRINWNLNVYNLAILYMYRFEEKLIPHTKLKKKQAVNK